ncbi:MAG: outer membrane protein assembly factor BamA [Gemmatimonadota bacterium]
MRLLLLLLALPLPAFGQVGELDEATGVVFVDSVEVRGAERLSEMVVLGTSALRAGTDISYRDIQQAIKTLWGTGQFDDVQILARGGDEDPVILTIQVQERPLLGRVTFQGLTSLNHGEVRDTVNLQSGQPYSPSRVADASAYIRDELARQGIPFVRIDSRLEAIPDRPDYEMELILDVLQGERVTVAQVEFQGNEAYSDGDLRGVLSTRQEGFWWFRTGRYEERQLEEDLTEALPEFYASDGYLDFQVLGDTLIIDDVTGKARLEIQVDEGAQYRIADFSIQGNRRFPTAELEQYFQQERGGLLRSLGLSRDRDSGPPVFDQAAFNAATDRVGQLYRNQGYLYANVEPFVEKGIDEDGPRVELSWRIQEGNPAYIRRVEIAGNEFTHDRVIREQIFIFPDDVYSEARLLQSYQAISGLGFFETPMEFPTISPDPQTGDVDITFHVAEKQTGSINFGTAVGGGTGVAGFLGYDQPNLFGQAKAGSLRWDFGRWQNNFTLSYSDPALRESRVGGTFSVFSSRDRFFQFATGERRRTGASTRFRLPVPGSLRTGLFLGYTLSRTSYSQRSGVDDTSLFGRPPGTQSTVSVGIVRNTLDHPIFPVAGSRQSLNAELNGGPLGGDARFVKTLAEGTWYTPVGQLGGNSPGSRPIQFSLGLSLRGGTIFGDASNFPFDQFWMGGVQFGESLRGYDETTVTPRGYFERGSRSVSDIDRLGNAYVMATAQYAVRFNDNLGASLFYDAGGVWNGPREVDPSRLFRGAGIGVQLVTPFGPLGLDWAYGFDKTVPGWQLHFKMGGGF